MDIKRSVKHRVNKLLGRPTSHRRFISSNLGVTGFLIILKENHIDYVVLRWFEELPVVQVGEDVDILVSDKDVEKLTSLLNVSGKGADTPCDIYSVSGRPGTSSHGLPYYPEKNALSILKNAVWVNGMVRAPGPDEHFLSICYHAVYRKGYASGIPSRNEALTHKVVIPRDHDYVHEIDRLHKLSSYRGQPLELTLEGVDALLHERSWRPEPEVLKRMASRNEWMRDGLLMEHTALS